MRHTLFFLAAGLLVAATPAMAQSLELNGRKLTLSTHEMKVLGELRILLPSSNRGAQDKALAAARAGAQGSDARHVLATYELEIANQRGDTAMRTRALDVLIASDLTTPANLISYLSVRGGIAFQAGDFPTAKKHWGRLAEMKPDDPQVLANLAQVRLAENDAGGAIQLIESAIARQAASGKPVPEGLYRQWLSIANGARMAGPGFKAGLALVRAYPTAQNWRDSLVVYRQLAQPQGGLEIDTLRLMRATGTLTKPPEWLRLAQLLNAAGFPAEARKVIDEGWDKFILDPVDPTTRSISAEIDRTLAKPRGPMTPLANADALMGAGQYDQAIAAYRAVPGDEAVLHLGMTLVLANRQAEAKPVFRALAEKPGAYGELAGFWLAWIESNPR